MKLLIWVILTVAITSCNPKSTRDNIPENADYSSTEDMEKKGFAIFQESPHTAIDIFEHVVVDHEKNGNLKKAGITNLNIANIYDEYLEKTDSALIYSTKALEIWKELNDTLQMANLHKYIGLLKGKSGDYDKAKYHIHQAIFMYQNVGFEQGVSVSEINLADVYLREGNFTESEVLFIKSTTYWKEIGDSGRVFTNNILGIKIYNMIGDKAKVEKLIKENKVIMKQTELDEFILNKFNELFNESK